MFRKVRALLGGQVLYMTSGSAPLAGDVLEMLKICFSCDVVQGVRILPRSEGDQAD